MTVLIAILLGCAVAATWLSALAILRMPRALDRLHAVSFLNIVAGIAITAAGFVSDGVSVRSLKILLITVLLVGFGAVITHAAGRAMLLREGRSA
ncbi:monovalent cation/H(+) antiporter subunit G [Methylobacterium sp. J-067]|uniref:monovalent cation/H(+) antiporter subunit G n=1 Tax=Methylobacterium sp. J-067 TaxID=2836648 RepID=UPI001FBA2C09|nr:monovalent cation/H(+) antiporter subunit G [Methylobacterium sp. J-067]MCJ2027031.1 monovalent cation/H(+) antiporter subunit G [Methylobacterium sp. J-067]